MDGKLNGKTVVLFLENIYNELEFWYPKIRLEEEGARVIVAATEGGATYKSKVGLPAASDAAFSSLSADDVDAVVIPGGFAPDFMRRSPHAVDLVRKAFDQGKPVAFICHAGWVPVSAGILKGRRCTSYFAIKDDLVNAGAQWVDEPVVKDGNLISSRKPEDLPHFCRAIIDALS